MSIQLSHIVLVLALVAGAYLLLGRRAASSSDSKPANGYANGSGLKGANSGTTAQLDAGRDIVAALQQAVSRPHRKPSASALGPLDFLRGPCPRDRALEAKRRQRESVSRNAVLLV